MLILLALLIGVVAGLRAMIAPAAVSWAAHSRGLGLDGSILAFMGYRFTPWVFSAFAVLELISDQLPNTPSRKVPVQFVTRLLMGGLAGGTLGATADMLVVGALAGVVGAVIGTFGGASLRSALASAFGSDRPAALIEDAIAIVGAALIVLCL